MIPTPPWHPSLLRWGVPTGFFWGSKGRDLAQFPAQGRDQRPAQPWQCPGGCRDGQGGLRIHPWLGSLPWEPGTGVGLSPAEMDPQGPFPAPLPQNRPPKIGSWARGAAAGPDPVSPGNLSHGGTRRSPRGFRGLLPPPTVPPPVPRGASRGCHLPVPSGPLVTTPPPNQRFSLFFFWQEEENGNRAGEDIGDPGDSGTGSHGGLGGVTRGSRGVLPLSPQP